MKDTELDLQPLDNYSKATFAYYGKLMVASEVSEVILSFTCHEFDQDYLEMRDLGYQDAMDIHSVY